MTIYIGITGLPGSGKEEVKNLILRQLRDVGVTLYYWSISKDVRTEVNKTNYKRADVSAISSSLKEQFGPNILAIRAVKHLEDTFNLQNSPQVVVMDSIKNSHEVKHFRYVFGRQFKLIGIQVDSIEVLIDRLNKRNRFDEDATTLIDREKARQMIVSEIGSANTNTGFDVGHCLEISDYIIRNESDLESLALNVNHLITSDLLPLLN